MTLIASVPFSFCSFYIGFANLSLNQNEQNSVSYPPNIGDSLQNHPTFHRKTMLLPACKRQSFAQKLAFLLLAVYSLSAGSVLLGRQQLTAGLLMVRWASFSAPFPCFFEFFLTGLNVNILLSHCQIVGCGNSSRFFRSLLSVLRNKRFSGDRKCKVSKRQFSLRSVPSGLLVPLLYG